MIAVLDAPVASDGGGPYACRKAGGGRDVIGDFTAFFPKAGGGAIEQRVAGDADDGFDEGLPLGGGQGVADGKDFNSAVFLARPSGVARKVDVGRGAVCGGDANAFKQSGLVRFQLDQKMVPRIAGALKSFFDSAWHPG